MKKIILLTLVLIASPMAFCASNISSGSCGAQSNADCTVTMAGTVTAGDTIFIAAMFGFSPGTLSCGDSAGQTYTVDLTDTTTGLPFILCRKSGTAGGVTTVKTHASGFDSGPSIVAWTEAGSATLNGISSVKDNGFGTSASWTSNAIVPVGSDIVIGIAGDPRTAAQVFTSTGGGFTAIGFQGSSGTIFASEKSTAASASVSGSVTQNLGSAQVISYNLDYTMSGGGGPTPPHTLTTLGAGIAQANPDNIIPLIGVTTEIAKCVPPYSDDLKPFQARQDAAIRDTISAMMRAGVVLPDKTDDADFKASTSFALNLAHAVTKSDFLDNGCVLTGWTRAAIKANTHNGVISSYDDVAATLGNLVDFAVMGGWITPRGIGKEQIKTFLKDFARVIVVYDLSGRLQNP
jgi:hypothetical protein